MMAKLPYTSPFSVLTTRNPGISQPSERQYPGPAVVTGTGSVAGRAGWVVAAAATELAGTGSVAAGAVSATGVDPAAGGCPPQLLHRFGQASRTFASSAQVALVTTPQNGPSTQTGSGAAAVFEATGVVSEAAAVVSEAAPHSES